MHNYNNFQNKAKEIKSAVKMIRKHKDEIINFFRESSTNAKIVRLNGTINRFIYNNYGIKNKDFSLYHIVCYFSQQPEFIFNKKNRCKLFVYNGLKRKSIFIKGYFTSSKSTSVTSESLPCPDDSASDCSYSAE